VAGVIVFNNRYDSLLATGSDWVKLEGPVDSLPLYGADLVNEEHPWRHDPEKLSKTLVDLLYEKTGPLSMKERDE
jgi:hypothetical protein